MVIQHVQGRVRITNWITLSDIDVKEAGAFPWDC